jgi:DNA (cytosine-5)-methyltransferase 1
LVDVEAFAGPGGWSEGRQLAEAALPAIGFELDPAACRTAAAAGHARVRADVAQVPLNLMAGRVDGLIMSPPCQAWSNAGEQLGKLDQPKVFERIAYFARGETPPDREWADDRSALTAEPMRWTVALRPRWIALEQVPPVLPLWRYTAELLRGLGYRVWCGILSAEQYGVPQTRKRAILIARRDGLPATPPTPTHQPYRAGREFDTADDLFGDPLPPPVSMAEALGWSPHWSVEYQRGAGMVERHGDRPHRPATAPGPTIRAGSKGSGPTLLVHTGNNSRIGGEETKPYARDIDSPAPTLTGNVNRWQIALRNGNQANACTRSVDEPAGTLFFGQRTNAVDWIRMAPAGATSQMVEPRPISEPGHTITGKATAAWVAGKDTARVTVQEAAALQSFPTNYPWQGGKSEQYRQVGDAVPPQLAAAILRSLVATAEPAAT